MNHPVDLSVHCPSNFVSSLVSEPREKKSAKRKVSLLPFRALARIVDSVYFLKEKKKNLKQFVQGLKANKN
jgi:hypothetical protein